jgi:hypothetical protein
VTRKAILTTGVVVVVIGVAAAFVYQRAVSGRQWVHAVEQSGALADRATAVYRAGPNDEAVVALRQYLNYLDASSPSREPWRPPAHPLLDARGLAFERTLTSGRLALVEAKLGNVEGAAQAWAQAEKAATDAGLAATDRESLEEMILQVDQNAGLRVRPPR